MRKTVEFPYALKKLFFPLGLKYNYLQLTMYGTLCQRLQGDIRIRCLPSYLKEDISHNRSIYHASMNVINVIGEL